MKILFIYRHPNMGFSIGKVFSPIEKEMKKYAEIDSVYMPVSNYSIQGLWKNIKVARKAVNAKHYDIIHITGTEHYLIPFLRSENVVVTVHDLGHLFNLRGVRKLRYWLLQVFSLRLAKAITCISNFTVQELNNVISIAANKVYVIPNEVDRSFVFEEKIFNDIDPVILHIGTRPHKNLSRTIKALNGIKCRLHIVGEISVEDMKLLKEFNINYKSLVNISDKELLNEYYNADIINFPSLHEGFGMPIIEGQAVGRIVVTSNIEPMKSVAGTGAAICNPYSVESMRDTYQKIINDSEYRNLLVRNGIENVKEYSLSSVTKQYFDLYKTL